VWLGFEYVNIIWQRSRAEMPAIEEEVAEAEKEGVKARPMSGAGRIITGGSKVNGPARAIETLAADI
jgi:hypothetical protein